MKKIIIAASLLLIGSFQIQASAQVEKTNNDNATEISLNTISTLNTAIIFSLESVNTSSTITENPSFIQTSKNNEEPALNLNDVFANRYKSLFWYEGRKIYA